jgi:glycosyltransferase involved in cell wall biosynthesis
LKDRQTRNTMSEEAKKRCMEKFSISHMLDSYEKIYFRMTQKV